MFNISNVKKIAISGIFIALAVIVEFIHFPIFPAFPFLEYDAAGIILLVLVFIVGKLFGSISSILTALLHVLIGGGNSGPYGFIMNALALTVFVISAKLATEIFEKLFKEKIISLIIAGILAVIITSVILIPANFIFTPLFTGMPISAVKALIIFPITSFNLIKWGINIVLGLVIVFILQKHIKQ